MEGWVTAERMTRHTIRRFLAAHPKLLGVLFVATTVLWETEIVTITIEEGGNGGP